MRVWSRPAAGGCFTGWLLWLSCYLHADTLTGKVVGVTDGDTITVLDGSRQTHKVRLSGIDAPEKDQPFGQKSKEHLSHLVHRQDVRVDWHKTDRYGRVIGQVWVRPSDCPKCEWNLDANKAQLTAGLAWWYRRYAHEQPKADQHAYEHEENEAKNRGVELWADAHSVPPWDWRRR